MKIATILHYSSNEYRFLQRNVEECRKFSHQILVTYSDHFFDGTPENRFLLQQSFAKHSDCTFVGFAFDVKRLYIPYVHCVPGEEEWLCYWHSTSRYVARFFVQGEIDWLFFLDADEIMEGEKFLAWLQQYKEEDLALWFWAYTYGLTADCRKNDWQLTGLLVRKDALVPHQILHPQERCGMFRDIVGKKRSQVTGLDGLPMIHHYSWVRTKAECRRKMSAWAKKNQKDWNGWLKAETGTANTLPYFEPLAVSLPSGQPIDIPWPNFVTRKQMLEKEHALL